MEETTYGKRIAILDRRSMSSSHTLIFLKDRKGKMLLCQLRPVLQTLGKTEI